jgi:hypothetical protein
MDIKDTMVIVIGYNPHFEATEYPAISSFDIKLLVLDFRQPIGAGC